MFPVNLTLNKGKAHFKFGDDRTDVTDSESNLITSTGDKAKETITAAALTFHTDRPQQGNNSTALCWCCFRSKTMDCIIQPERFMKVKKTWSHSTRTWTEQRTHTHSSCIHLSYPHMPHSYGKAPRWHCSAFSRAWSTASTAVAAGKALNKGAVTHSWRLSQLPAPAAQCLPAADFPNSSLSAEKLQSPTKRRQGAPVTAHRIHSACFRSIIQTQQHQFVLRFPKKQ